MSKELWIIANWKSNKTISEALTWIDEVGPKLSKKPNLKVIVCPTFLDLEEVKKSVLVGNFPLMVGAQDLSPFEEGPFTGEEAARLLKEVVDLAIIGHSERRTNFDETDQMVKDKVGQATQANIIPLVCIQDQKTPIPEGTKLVAFEPIAAIGTGNPDTPQNADLVAEEVLKNHPQVRVLYGGSVDSTNAKAYLQQEHLNGLLIGGSSLDSTEFVKIIETTYSI